MFKYSCYIRKNTKYLRNKLREFGYNVNINTNSESIATASTVGNAVGISFDSFDDTNPHRTWNCANRIDCKYNEDLFLAIAALRDDTDKNQWFIDKTNSWWWLCELDTFKEEFDTFNDEQYLKFEDFRKASIDELKNHFI